MSAGSTERLSRLLAEVPWLVSRPGVSLGEAARHFGISQDQLVKDLQLLFLCGTPGHMPDDLIEAEWESGQVYVGNADTIARPLRLDPDEAVALLVGLRTLADVPGLHDRAAVESALAKLSAAAGDALPAAAPPLAVDISAGAGEETLRTARAALRAHRRLRLRYLVPARDEVTERDVDPMRVTNMGGRWYLEAYCHRAEDVRLFRVDRVVGLDILDVDGTPPPGARPRDEEEGLFRPVGDEPLVTLELEPRGRWVAEYYPVEDAEELPGGRLRIELRTPQTLWVVRLALRLAGAGRVLGPPALVEQVRAAAAEALAVGS